MSKIVKRYANRKLYDTERSCYVTLEDIAGMIRAGEDVRVIDNKTGEDLTSVTLAQIIFEAEKKRNFMPMDLLRDLIRDRGDALGEFAREHVDRVQARASEFKESAERTAEKLRHELEGRISGVIGRKGEAESDETRPVEARPIEGKPVEGKAKINELINNSHRALDDLQRGLEDRIKSGVDAVARNPVVSKELDEIRKRLTSLKQRFEKQP